MKEIKIERTVYDVHYEAIDGTIFHCKEECEKYDESAKAVLWAKFKKLVVKEGTEYSLFNFGNDDTTVYAIKVETEADATVIKQLWELDHTYLCNNDRYAKYQKEAYDTIDTAYAEKDIILIGENCDGEIYIINTRANIMLILEKMEGLDKKQDDSEGK